ncbi:MAG: hypothetical protein ACJ71Q_01705 [Terriglobales bacterium]|jgi:hypothetical protein
MFIICSIVLMIAWIFMYLAFGVPASLSCALLGLAFSLFFFDWWLHGDRADAR